MRMHRAYISTWQQSARNGGLWFPSPHPACSTHFQSQPGIWELETPKHLVLGFPISKSVSRPLCSAWGWGKQGTGGKKK